MSLQIGERAGYKKMQFFPAVPKGLPCSVTGVMGNFHIFIV